MKYVKLLKISIINDNKKLDESLDMLPAIAHPAEILENKVIKNSVAFCFADDQDNLMAVIFLTVRKNNTIEITNLSASALTMRLIKSIATVLHIVQVKLNLPITYITEKNVIGKAMAKYYPAAIRIYN